MKTIETITVCTCPPGFYDAACRVHRFECDRQQLAYDLRRVSVRNRQPLIDDENKLPQRRV